MKEQLVLIIEAEPRELQALLRAGFTVRSNGDVQLDGEVNLHVLCPPEIYNDLQRQYEAGLLAENKIRLALGEKLITPSPGGWKPV